MRSNDLLELPDGIGALTNLHTLEAGGNRLEYIPTSIASLSKLQVLTLSNNSLQSLPDCIDKLQQLQVSGACCGVAAVLIDDHAYA